MLPGRWHRGRSRGVRTDPDTPPKKVIVCDDGSNSGPPAALDPLTDRIVTLRQENGRAASARNLRLRRATAAFTVAFPGRATRRSILLARPDFRTGLQSASGSGRP